MMSKILLFTCLHLSRYSVLFMHYVGTGSVVSPSVFDSSIREGVRENGEFGHIEKIGFEVLIVGVREDV